MHSTLIYLAGTLALHFTDFAHPHPFYRLFVPLVDVLFLIFLCWQLLFFMSLQQFSDGHHYRLQDLLVDIYDLRHDVAEQGWLRALAILGLNLFETACFFLALYYYLTLLIELVSR